MVRSTQVALRTEALSYNGEMIRRDKDGMVNLTDMWKAEGGTPHKAPAKWLRLDVTEGLIDFLSLKVRREDVLRAKAGRGGATWVIPNLAVAYAKYLSPQFYAWANQVILERIEEEANPELGITRSRARAIAAWKRQGKPGRWIQLRLQSIDVRHQFTDTLLEHGVKGVGYGVCTNAIYRPLLGGKAKEVLRDRELPSSATLRDHLSAVELAAVSLAETLSEETIEEKNLSGIQQCETACKWSGTHVANAVDRARESQQVIKRNS